MTKKFLTNDKGRGHIATILQKLSFRYQFVINLEVLSIFTIRQNVQNLLVAISIILGCAWNFSGKKICGIRTCDQIEIFYGEKYFDYKIVIWKIYKCICCYSGQTIENAYFFLVIFIFFMCKKTNGINQGAYSRYFNQFLTQKNSPTPCIKNEKKGNRHINGKEFSCIHRCFIEFCVLCFVFGHFFLVSKREHSSNFEECQVIIIESNVKTQSVLKETL